jgi:catechol 2,3-dioxygenase-like lactoylglutathione lyase family enzyme
MITISHVCLFVRDQDEALDFYTKKLGFEVRADVPLEEFRWLSVGPPAQPDVHIALLRPPAGLYDAATVAQVDELTAKGAMNGVILNVEDCRAAYEDLRARGVEFYEEPTEHFYGVDAGFRDPSGNSFRLVQPTPTGETAAPA